MKLNFILQNWVSTIPMTEQFFDTPRYLYASMEYKSTRSIRNQNNIGELNKKNKNWETKV